MKTLVEIFESHQGRQAHKPVKYLAIYDRHFQRFLGKPVTILEIGVGQGGSLQLWKQYFGSEAKVIGIDCEPLCAGMVEDQIQVCIGPQQDAAFLRDVVEELGAPDIVIDDAGHRTVETCATFKALYPLLPPYGMYVVEDLGTSYWVSYGGGLHHPESFIEMTKSLIDEMHAAAQGSSPTEFCATTEGIHIYENLFIFEKHPYVPTIGVLRGGQ